MADQVPHSVTPVGRATRYAVLLIVLSVPCWVLGGLFPPIRVGALNLPVSALMFLVPAVTAGILVGRAGGSAAVGVLLRRAVEGRGAWWRVAAATTVPALVAVAAMAALGELGSWPVPTLLVLFLVFLLPGVCEELGWAYVSDALWERFGPIIPGLMVGAFVSLWHLIPLLQAGNEWRWIAAWALSSSTARVVMMWCYVRTGAAVPTLIGMHAMFNVCAAGVPGYNGVAGQAAGGVVLAVLGLVLTIASLRSRAAATVSRPALADGQPSGPADRSTAPP